MENPNETPETPTPTPNPDDEWMSIHGKGSAPNIPAGAEDVTDRVVMSSGPQSNPLGGSGGVPPPGKAGSPFSARTFHTPQGIMGRQNAEAENTTFLAHLAQGEEKGLVNRHISLDRDTDWSMRELVNQNDDYNGSVAEFVRHAVSLLVGYYIETGQFPPATIGLAADIWRQQKMLRLEAQREKMRLDLVTDIKILDKGLEMSRRTNDMAAIAKRLTDYKDMLDNCPSEAQRQQVRGVFLESVATRSAVQAFHKWTHNRYRIEVGEWDDSWVELSEQWHDWFMDEDALS